MEQGSRSKTPIIAIGAAGVALVTSIVAVVLLVTRSPSQPATVATGSGSSEATAGSGSATPTAAPASSGIVEASISAADVLKLKQRENIDDATDGVSVTDEPLRKALKLETSDIIVALNGRTVGRELDIYDAMMGLTMSETTTVYVDLMRDGKPQLLRWKLDVSMRSAWRTSLSLGSTPYGSTSASTDPAIIATVREIDDTTFEAPRRAIDVLFDTASNSGARLVPSYRNGSTNGVKLYAIRPTSIYSAFGLENGDTIMSINGDRVTSIDGLGDVYRSHKSAIRLELELERRSDTITLVIKLK